MPGAVGCLPQGDRPVTQATRKTSRIFRQGVQPKCGPARLLWIRLDVSEYYVIRTITIFDSSAGGAGFKNIARVLNPMPGWCCLLLVELKW